MPSAIIRAGRKFGKENPLISGYYSQGDGKRGKPYPDRRPLLEPIRHTSERFRTPILIPNDSGAGTLIVAEQLASQQVLLQRRAVDRRHWPIAVRQTQTGGRFMPTGAFAYRSESERRVLEQAVAFIAEMHTLTQAAPDGQVLHACEGHALAEWSEFWASMAA